ncbi:S-layer homology domain-containing protein [Paenibacillus sp. HWE-109]|uniref:invasin domain 3-containing protein n=1 Tax=Paenibacillus sp. HWE-109 TaxID=1306526 RepID=UPI001EE04405|nr:invasin domain 3-containing protein [Paenibacillus sp. HWE-109]UKS25479.1 S-layer homology domain-containing protein [Paenibacillus sp. HWE-109]
MKGMKQGNRWIAILLIVMVAISGVTGGQATAASGVLDQAQVNVTGNVWVNHDYPRYQTFTPAITGYLSKIDLNIFDSYGTPGAISLSIYKEGDLSTPLATAQLASFGVGWVALDFSGASPYLKKNTMYRMVASTEFGGASSGFGWYSSNNNPYPGGMGMVANLDFSFRTYMVADYSISPTESGISSANASLVADGTSQTTLSVKLKDAQGSDLTSGGATVAITSTLGTVGPVTDNQNGTYTALLTAPTVLGTATVQANVGGSALAATASVQFVTGAPSPAHSTLAAGDASLTADGTSQTTLSVKLKDAQGHALTSGGAAVAITSTLGTVGPVTDNQNGTYTAVLTAPTALGTATVQASVGGSALAATASVQFVTGAPSPAHSTLAAGDASLTADGTSQTTLSVKLKDAQGHALTSGGAAVAITSTLGTVGPVTDNQNGTYTAVLTAPTALGTATVQASVGGSALAATASVQFVTGAPSPARSTLAAGDASLTADGTSETTLSVKLKDAQGHALTSGGAAVAITSTLGTVGPVTDNQNGTYTALLKAPVALGTATVQASVGGSALAATASVQFVTGAPSPAHSTLAAGDASLTADGTSQTTLSVKLKDAQGHALTSGGAAVAITSTLGTVGPVTDNQNGTYTALLTAPVTLGTATVQASVGGSALAATASVQFVTGAPSPAHSTLAAGDASLTADGTSQTTLSVKLKDAQGHALTSGGATVAITSTLGTVGPVTDNQNGSYTALLTAPVTLGTATVRASLGGSALAATASVQFVTGPVSSSRSTVTTSDLVVRADGHSKASILIKLKDEYDHPIVGKRVLLQANGGQSVIDAVYEVTNEDGLANYLVSNTTAENVTYSAKDGTSNLSLLQTVNIAFTYDQPPNIELRTDPVIPTFGNVTVTVTATVYGEFNRVAAIKWAAGSRALSYFDTQGVQINDHFTVQENGIYSVYVLDTAGNANVSLLEVQNIVPLSSNANLTGWQLTGLGGVVKFDFDAGKISNRVDVSHSVYGLKMILTTTDVYSSVYVNGIQVAGSSMTDEYALITGENLFEITVKAQDGSIKTYSLSVVRALPSPEPDSSSSSETNPTAANRSLKVRINDQGVSGIATFQIDANGVKSIDVLLDLGTLKKVLDPLNRAADANLTISIDDEAGKVALRIPGDALDLLAKKSAILTLQTQLGQYRLPLAEVVNQTTIWTDGGEAQITIEHGKGEKMRELQDAANKGGFQLMADPIYFDVHVLQEGKRRELASFTRFVERAIYLPSSMAGTASTVVVWDQQSGVRPVPTEFIQVDGHSVALIHSLTNSAYVVVSKKLQLSDTQGHWAASEIAKISGRMIVQGIDESRFAPDVAITRAELAALLVRALGLPIGGNHTDFRDVAEASWYSGAVAAAKAYGMMDGFSEGTFGPNQEVSRQEAIVTFVRALKLADAPSLTGHASEQVDLAVYADRSQISNWASDAIKTALAAGIMNGYGNELRPQKSLTRAETTVLLYRMLLQAGFINE